VIQEMTMSTREATHYESAVRAMSQAAAEAELTHAPVRLAYWRIAAMDTLLDRLEELRLAGERALPEDIRDLVVAYAARYDAELADRVQRIDPEDLNAVHDAVFEAQGRVMLELAQLRRVPNWQDLDLTLAPGDDEAA
jgi:type VI protein secretion system component VasF